jgi:diguanylate cyclase (GGDEF)-like protein
VPGSAAPVGAASEAAPAGRGSGPLVAPPDPHVDRLTDLFGPEIFERLLVAESARVRRYRRPASLVLAEIAGLDALAHAWGVDVATTAVESLATVLRKGSRTSDFVGRVAVDRFAVILTETDEIAAINYVERVREAWESLPAIAAGTVRVGFGWAGTPSRATLLDARPSAEEVLRGDLRERPA